MLWSTVGMSVDRETWGLSQVSACRGSLQSGDALCSDLDDTVADCSVEESGWEEERIEREMEDMWEIEVESSVPERVHYSLTEMQASAACH